PVPIGFSCIHSCPFSLITFSDCMTSAVIRSTNSGYGPSVLKRAVWSSRTSTLLILTWLLRAVSFLSGSRTRSNDALTSRAVKGVPSWNLTPGRSLTSQVVSSRFFHAVARLGPTLPVLRSRAVERRLAHGARVRVLDNFSTGTRANLPFARAAGRRLEVIRGDIRNRAVVARAARGVRVIFHQAAMRSVPRSVKDPLGANEN